MTTTGPAALDARPSRRRVVLAAAPWVLAACLAAAGLYWRTNLPPAAGFAAPPAAPSEGAPATPGVGNAATPTTSRSDPVVPAALPQQVALAVVAAARTALGTAGLGDGTGPHPDRWALDVRVVAAQPVTAAVSVVTVHGLVIDRTAEGWSDPAVRAVAVPVATGDAPGVLGPGWPLPAPPAASVDLDARPVAEPAPALVEPLLEAGWDVQEVTAVDLVAGALLRLRLHGTPPDGTTAADHEVWLHDAPAGPRLLPSPVPATAPARATPTARPSDRQRTEEST